MGKGEGPAGGEGERLAGLPKAVYVASYNPTDISTDLGALWAELRKIDLEHTVVVTSTAANLNSKTAAGGHSYSLLDIVDCRGFRLVELRNPWANSVEWKGAWSDSSSTWKRNPDVARDLDFKPAPDGLFWMAFDDFCHHFATLDWYATKRAEQQAQRNLARRRPQRKR